MAWSVCSMAIASGAAAAGSLAGCSSLPAAKAVAPANSSSTTVRGMNLSIIILLTTTADLQRVPHGDFRKAPGGY